MFLTVSDIRFVIFDSNPKDIRFLDRLILWTDGFKYGLDSYVDGELFTNLLSEFEVEEFMERVRNS